MPSKEELLSKAKQPAEDAMRWHPFYRGKVQVMPKCPVRGLGDFANQVNNSLGFPGIFRGALDVRARTISDEMAIAAANELAAFAEEQGLSETLVVPRMDQWQVYPRVAVATAMQAQQQGIAELRKSREQLHEEATKLISHARQATELLARKRIIEAPP